MKKIKIVFSEIVYIIKTLLKFKKINIILYILITSLIGLAPAFQLRILDNILDFTRVSDTQVALINGGVLILIGALVVALLHSIDYVSMLMNSVLANRITYNLDNAIISKMKEIDLASFDDPNFLNFHENAKEQSEGSILETVAIGNVFITTIISIIGYVVLVSEFNILILFIILLTLIPSIIFQMLYKKKHYNFFIEQALFRRKRQYYLDVLTNKSFYKERRCFGYEKYFEDRKKREFEKFAKSNYQLHLKESIWSFINRSIGHIGSSLCIIWVFIEIINRKFEPIRFATTYFAINSLEDALSGIFSVASTGYENFLYFDLLYKFLTMKPTLKNGHIKVNTNIKSHIIDFKDVWFQYPNTQIYTLKGISFSMTTSEKILIVGQNGSGKSTIIKLILRYYDVTKGEILIDGINIKEFERLDLMNLFSVVFQDYNQYSLTLKDNIKIGSINCEINADCIENKLNIDEMAENLPNGLDTELTKLFEENATDLSVGQWQRIALLRMFNKNAPIVIFDEPTAALDTIAESEIHKIINSYDDNKLVIFISHMILNTKIASKIIVVENGIVSGIGTHKELYNKNREYTLLHDSITHQN